MGDGILWVSVELQTGLMQQLLTDWSAAGVTAFQVEAFLTSH
jgi:hypothetical protein